MGDLSPREKAIVARALDLDLLADRPPAYLSPNLCTALSLVLAIPTLGFSLLLVPIAWVAQYEHTAGRIEALRRRIEGLGPPAGANPETGTA